MFIRFYKPLFLPVDIQHIHRPGWFFNPTAAAER